MPQAASSSKLQPASANQPLRPRRPATRAVVSTEATGLRLLGQPRRQRGELEHLQVHEGRPSPPRSRAVDLLHFERHVGGREQVHRLIGVEFVRSLEATQRDLGVARSVGLEALQVDVASLLFDLRRRGRGCGTVRVRARARARMRARAVLRVLDQAVWDGRLG